ncbi:TPA: prepilin peptidase, partial [Vibrio cholerae]|nr:prepilin peptidase [Vibrio cholerae]
RIDIDAISAKIDFEKSELSSFIECFACSTNNTNFNNVTDLNEVKLRPIINFNDNYYIFNSYSLLENLYESPMFWIRDTDKEYLKQAEKHRGEYVEKMTIKYLKKVFGEKNVFSNIEIYRDPKTRISEIDVLVLFGNKALIFQAKSKALTLPARQGDGDAAKRDFVAAVQNAYDQAVKCAKALHSKNVILKDENNQKIELNLDIDCFYPIAITSEHYPSLTFQSLNMLTLDRDLELIKKPFVMDIFFLDVMSEFLNTPLYFISYIDRRAGYFNDFVASSELTILSHHLKDNLWLSSDYTFACLDESICGDLDHAIMSRRIPYWGGKKTPEGILTYHVNTPFSRLISVIDKGDDRGVINFGLELLKFSSKAINDFNKAVDGCSYKCIQDSKLHDFSLLMDEYGVTVHVDLCKNKMDLEHEANRMLAHMNMKKYSCKFDKWFGVLFDAITKYPVFMGGVDFPWAYDEDMEKAIPKEIKNNTKKISPSDIQKKMKFKIGRNDKCPCGSGNKYKRCCGR